MLKLSGAILALVVVGTPIVAYLWQTANELLSGRFDAVRVVVAVPILALLILLLIFSTSVVGRLDAHQGQLLSPPEEPKP